MRTRFVWGRGCRYTVAMASMLQPHINTRDDAYFRFLGCPTLMRSTGETTNGAFGLLEHWDVPPGFGTPYHVHRAEDEAFYVLETAAMIMENVPELSEEVWPGLDWEWLKVPLQADAEIGINWGQTVEFDHKNYNPDELWEKVLGKAAEKIAA